MTMTEDPNCCSPSDVENNRTVALLSYLGILFLVPLIVAKKSKFAMFHVNQGIIFFIACIALTMIWWALANFFYIIPIIGMILYPLSFLAYAAIILGGIFYGAMNCVRGLCKPLPWIGELAVFVKHEE